MDTAKKNLLNYFKTTVELDNLTTVEYSRQAGRYWQLSSDESNIIQDGRLSERLTNEIFETYFREKGITEERRSNYSSVSVIVSLCSIKSDTKVFGLLNLACSLSKGGQLSTDEDPWMPLDRLKSPDRNPVGIIAGQLDDYWKFRQTEGAVLEERAETWQDHVQYAGSLFSYVTQKAEKNPEDSKETLIDSDVYIKLGDHASAYETIIDLYKRLTTRNTMPALLATTTKTRSGQGNINEVDYDEKMQANMIATCASMTKDSPLDDAERHTVHAFVTMKQGEILAANELFDENKSALLRDVVANLIVQHALKKKAAPLIVGTSMNSQDVTSFVESFADLTSEEDEDGNALYSRWLPIRSLAGGTPGAIQGTQMLKGIATYCSTQSNGFAASEAQRFELVEDIRKGGVYAAYTEKIYTDEAAQSVKRFAQSLLEEAEDIPSIQKKLHENLRELDEERKKLIKVAAEIGIASQSVTEKVDMRDESARTKLDEKIAQANENVAEAQERLNYWINLESDRPLKGVFRKKPSPSDEDLIYAKKQPDDTFDSSVKTLEEVKDYYKREIDKHDTISSEYLSTKHKYQKSMQAYSGALQSMKTLLNKMTGNREMSQQIDARASKLNPHNEDFLAKLDALLDTTVRYAEFWFALHYYECQWLIDCTTPHNVIDRNVRSQQSEETQKLYWREITSVSPCFAMTGYQLPKYFALYKNKQKEPDVDRIDLLIIDDADEINTPVMLAPLALAKKALVVGSGDKTPVWCLTPDADKRIAKDNNTLAGWMKRQECGLTASEPSSLLRAATCASPWSC